MRILFQGDSITDAGRSRDRDENIGNGYAFLVKATLGLDFPNQYEFFNRGISGDRIVDIYARMKQDIINLKPDVMSILAGVNDVWKDLLESPDGVDAAKYFKIYDMLIAEVLEALPNLKIMVLEPFVLKACSTEKQWDLFQTEVHKRAQMAKKIAEKYQLPYIKLQDGFDRLAKQKEPSYWVADGVHPTPMGHEYIKREWLKGFSLLNNSFRDK